MCYLGNRVVHCSISPFCVQNGSKRLKMGKFPPYCMQTGEVKLGIFPAVDPPFLLSSREAQYGDNSALCHIAKWVLIRVTSWLFPILQDYRMGNYPHTAVLQNGVPRVAVLQNGENLILLWCSILGRI